MVSINDVAKRAGVSNATVSRVLTDYPHVSEKLRQRVLQVIDELGYQPDKTARRLRSQSSSQVIGLIVSSIQNPHFGALVRGIEDYAYQHRMNVILCNTNDTDEREEFYINLMQSERAAGVLINPIGPRAGSMLEQLRSLGIAVVLLDNQSKDFPSDSIGVNDWKGAYLATSHLLEMGHQHVAIIAGRQTQFTGVERLRGYEDALKDAGVEIDPELIIATDYTTEAGYEATKHLIQNIKPQAIFSCNNSLTLGVLKGITESGLEVPTDVALAAFDDLPCAEYLCSPLTVIAQPAYRIGVEAGRLIQRRIDNPDIDFVNVELPCELIIRASCGYRK